MKQARGFTIVDLLFLLGAIVIVCLIGMIALERIKIMPVPPICLANLNGIGTGMAMYASENNDAPPILPDMDQSQAADYREDLRLGSECTAASLGTGAQQNLCLLIQAGILGWDFFNCPAVGKEMAERAEDTKAYGLGRVINGTHESYIHYAVQIPYLKTPEGVNSCPWRAKMKANVAIVADRGPQSEFQTRWSPNHGNEGEHVLFGDGHVSWYDRHSVRSGPNKAGYYGNNIYTADEWGGSPDAPALKRNGTENRTPTDPNGTRDSVLYHWW